MLTRITSARYLGDHSVWLCFSDGLEGPVNLSRDLAGEVFEPLPDRRRARLRSVHVAGDHLVCQQLVDRGDDRA